MNSSYRLVYSEAHKTWVAVAEHVSARGKKGTLRLLTNIALLTSSAAAAPWAMAAPPPAVNQLPIGAQVAAGSVAISQTQTAIAASMAVQQSSNQAIVNWQSFNVGANATVTVHQPSSSSVLLNRVLDSNPSQIFGQIKANGQVFLTNPSGVYFAPGSSVDVGSFTATTHGISDSDFLSGKYTFSRNGARGTITNQGSITAGLGGYIALLAPEVRNQGVVLAQLGGTVALAAGESYQLQINNNNKLSNVLVTPSTINTLVENGNAVQAPGGLVILSAQAASSLLGGVVKNSGSISATGLVSDGGVIRLRATNTIELAPTSSITADAAPGSAGNGGRIEVIADLANLGSSTQVDGTLSAKGADQGGDGGFIETSASQLKIADTARVTTLAPQGQAGTWLLDPTDFTIAATGGNITGTTVSNNLRSGNVTITSASGTSGTTGDINVNDNVAWSANVLTLTATNNVNVNANLSGSGTSDLTINGNGLSGSGNMSVGSARTLTVNQSGSSAYSGVMSGSGNLLLSGTGSLNLSGDNSYTGYTWVKSGTLQLGSGSTLGNTSAIHLSSHIGSGNDYRYTSGTLDLNGQSVTNTAPPLVLLAPSGSNLILNSSANKATFAGTVNPNQGVGTFILTGGDIEMSGALGGLAVGGYDVGGYAGLQFQGTHTLIVSGTTPRTWNGSVTAYNFSAKSGSPTVKVTGDFGPDINRLLGVMTFVADTASNLRVTTGVTSSDGSPEIAINIIKDGAGTLTLSGINYSTGTITVNAGTLAITNNTMPNLASITVNSGSALDLQNVSLSRPVILDGGSLTASTGSSTLSGSVTLGDNSGVGGAGAIILSGAITSNGYGLALVGAGAKTLSSTSNSLTTIATGAGVGAVTVVNNTALTIGQVTAGGTTYGGIDSTGAVSVTTRNASLTVAQPVTTSSTAANALQLLVSAGYSVVNVTPIYVLPASGLTGEYGIAPLLNYWYSSSPSSVVSVAYTGIPSTVQSFSLVSGAVSNTINVAGGVTGTLSLTGSPSIATGGLVATTHAGTYSLTLSPSLTLAGYAFYAGNAVNYTINPKAVTVTNGSRSTTYDGTTTYASLGNASTFSTTALVGSDSVASVTRSAIPTGVAQAGSFNLTPSAAVMGTGLASNYAFSYLAGTTTVGKATASVVGARTYDGTSTLAPADLTVSGVNGETLALSGMGTATAASKNVADNASDYVSSFASLALANGTGLASNYQLPATSRNANNRVTLSQANLTLAPVSDTKTYDRTVDSSATVIVTGKAAADTVTVAEQFGSKNALGANASTLSIKAGYTIVDGANADMSGNYSITATTATGTIRKADLSVSGLGAQDKTYDASTSAILSGAATITALAGDTVILGGAASGAFANKNAGTAKAVTVSGNTISGTDAANYTLVQQSGLSANITQASLTVTANSDARFVTLADNAGYGGVSYSGFVGAETSASAGLGGALSISRSNRLSDVAAGRYAGVLLGSGLTSGNYAISYAPGDYAIVPAQQLLVKVANSSNVYGSAAGYSISSAQYLNGANVLFDLVQTSASGATYTYGDLNGGSVTFTLAPASPSNSTSGQLRVGNYQLGASSFSIGGSNFNALNIVGAQTVTQKALSVSYAGLAKTYDATRWASVNTADDRVVGDVLSIARTATFGDKNVGADKAISVSAVALSGADAGNYTVAATGATTASVTQAALSLSGLSAAGKTYDGNRTATLSGTAAITPFSSDMVTLSGTAVGSFADKNAGTGKAITVTGSTISGTDAANYALAQQSGLSADITQASLTVSGLTSRNKTYDGTTATVLSGTASITALAGDTVTLGGTAIGTFADKNAGTAKAITVTGNTLSGADAGNYHLLQQTGLSANITPASLTVTANNDSKLYDGVAYSGGKGVAYSGFADGESSLVLSGGLGYSGTSQNAKNAGSYTVTPKGLTSTNYTVRFVDGTLTVSPAPLTLTALTNTKVFDGTTSAQALPVATGFMGSDSVTNLFEAYADANSGTGKTLAVQSGFVIQDGNAGANYVVTQVPDVSGVIRATPVTVSPPAAVVVVTASNAAPILAISPRAMTTPTTTTASSSAGVAVNTVNQAIEGTPGLVDVVVPIGTTSSGTSLVIALPEAVFANATEAGATESVTLANNQPLPAWMRYDTASKTLVTGAVPIGALPMSVVVTVGNQSTVVQISESQAKR